MKVLQVGKYYWPKSGGIEKHIKLLSEGLTANRVKVEVVVSNTKNKKEVNLINGVKVTKLPKLFSFFNQPITLDLFNFLKTEKSDIIHVHLPNPLASIATLLSKKKNVVVTYHSDIIGKPLAFIANFFTENLLKKASTIIVQSPNYSNSSKILQKYKNKTVVIPSCIDVKEYVITKKVKEKIKKLKSALDLRRKFVVLFVGRLAPYKGLEYLIKAFKKVSDKFGDKIKLLIVGEGDLKQRLINEVVKLKLEKNVKFIGYVKDDDLIAYYNLCDIFVLPSITRQEAFGLVQLEAMICGKPVISTNIESGVSFVNQHNKTGLIVPPKDPKSLAKAIITLFQNERMRKKFSRNCIKRVKLFFNKELMIKKTLEVYDKILNSWKSDF
ncbi:MAG: glycosyltransferase [Candidatus Aenigmatarchaeota archaeon]